jgi:hypothetical protein
MIDGKAKIINFTTSKKGAFFERTSSAINKIWFTKKTRKKNRKEMKK